MIFLPGEKQVVKIMRSFVKVYVLFHSAPIEDRKRPAGFAVLRNQSSRWLRLVIPIFARRYFSPKRLLLSLSQRCINLPYFVLDQLCVVCNCYFHVTVHFLVEGQHLFRYSRGFAVGSWEGSVDGSERAGRPAAQRSEWEYNLKWKRKLKISENEK